jgi:hypothetical protein
LEQLRVSLVEKELPSPPLDAESLRTFITLIGSEALKDKSGRLCLSVILTVLGPAVWVKVLGFTTPIVSLDPLTLVTMPLGFLVCWLASILDRTRAGAEERSRFPEQYDRSIA